MTSDNKKDALTYKDKDGNDVFTSTYLSNRGTCCKSNCLHCPYGFTAKNFGIEVSPIDEEEISFANDIIKDSTAVELDPLSKSLLSGAFGKNDRVGSIHVTEDNITNFAFGTFRNTICAVIEYSTRLSESASGKMVKELYLKKEFQNQGLEKAHIK